MRASFIELGSSLKSMKRVQCSHYSQHNRSSRCKYSGTIKDYSYCSQLFLTAICLTLSLSLRQLRFQYSHLFYDIDFTLFIVCFLTFRSRFVTVRLLPSHPHNSASAHSSLLFRGAWVSEQLSPFHPILMCITLHLQLSLPLCTASSLPPSSLPLPHLLQHSPCRCSSQTIIDCRSDKLNK